MTVFDLPYWLMVSFLFVLGAIAGSFLNVCIYRIPQHPTVWSALQGLYSPPSRCPRCRTRIAWRDNIPILGWILLRGRCRQCQMWITPRYPAIELLNALLFVALYVCEVPNGWPVKVDESSVYSEHGPQVVPGLGGMAPITFLHLRYFYHLVLVEALLVASFIDFDRREIPDASTLPAMFVGVVGALLLGCVHIVPLWTQKPHQIALLTRLFWPEWEVHTWPEVPAWFTTWPHLHGLLVSLVGLLVAGGVTWGVRLMGQFVLRKEAMGFGDVILMALVGSFLGWQPALMAFVLAPAFAIIALPIQLFAHRDRYIPYGPYLSLGALAVMMTFRPLWDGFGGWGGFGGMFELGPLFVILLAGMAVLFLFTLCLVQGGKRMIGLRDDGDEAPAVWTAADQSQYQAGERVETDIGQWHMNGWPGRLSGRGMLHNDRWRRTGRGQ